MKLVLLAGGFGTRFSEETKKKPKPLIRIGPKPIIWHIMKIYSAHGIKDFIICLGYKGEMIKNTIKKEAKIQNWNIKFVKTGLKTMTGGRIKRIKNFIGKDNFFFMSYGDGLCNVNIKKLISFHLRKKKIATITAIRQPSRFGILKINKSNIVTECREKPLNYINGGFFVLSKAIFSYIKNDNTIFEKDCLTKLSNNRQLASYKHHGFWSCMDTLKEKIHITKLWNQKNCPWKIW